MGNKSSKTRNQNKKLNKKYTVVKEDQKEILEPCYESRTFVLDNIPTSYDPVLIKDYIEGTLDLDVQQVETYAYIPGKALVTFQQCLTDFTSSSEKVKQERLEGNQLCLLQTKLEPAVVVIQQQFRISDIEKLKENICVNSGAVLHFQTSFPEYKMTILHFLPQYQDKIKQILELNSFEHICGCSNVTIHPFYSKFHDLISRTPFTGDSVLQNKSLRKYFSLDRLDDNVSADISNKNKLIFGSQNCLNLPSSNSFSTVLHEFKIKHTPQFTIPTINEQQLCGTSRQSLTKTVKLSDHINISINSFEWRIILNKLKKKLSEENVQIEQCKNSLLITAFDPTLLEDAENYLKKKIDFQSTIILPTEITDKDITTVRLKATSLVKMVKSRDGKQLTLSGVKKYVLLAVNEANLMLQHKISQIEENDKEIVDIVKVTDTQAQLLLQRSFSFHKCHVEVVHETCEIFLKGLQSAVKTSKIELENILKKYKESYIQLGQEVNDILNTVRGQLYITHILSSYRDVYVVRKDRIIHISALDESLIVKTEQQLRNEFDCIEKFETSSSVPLDKLFTFKSEIEATYLVKLAWDNSKTRFTMTGIRSELIQCKVKVIHFLEDFRESVIKHSFKNEIVAKYCFLLLQKRNIQTSLDKCLVSVNVRGSQSKVNDINEFIKNFERQTVLHKWRLLEDFKTQEVGLISHAYNSEILKQLEQKYLKIDDVLIIFKFPSGGKLQPVNILHSETTGSFHLETHTMKNKEFQATEEIEQMVFDIGGSCQLVIKSFGNVAEEKADLLVSVLGSGKDMRKTRIGRSFLKVSPSHWRLLKECEKSTSDSSVLTVIKPKDFSCMAICHVVLEPWDENISKTKLKEAMNIIFKQAKSFGARSVALPVLGRGRLFHFPLSFVVKVMTQTVEQEAKRNGLTKVVLISPDMNEFKEITKRSASMFALNEGEKVRNPNNDSEIIVASQRKENFSSLKIRIKMDLIEQCFQIEYFNQNTIKDWPSSSWIKIVEEANKLPLLVEKSKDPKTKCIGFLLRGEKNNIRRMKFFIQQEYTRETNHLTKKLSIFGNVPKRGTVEFLKYAAECDHEFPSYWKLSKEKKISEQCRLTEVETDIKNAIVKLVKETFDPLLVGKGVDAKNLCHCSIEVVDIKRIENPELFKAYEHQRKKLFSRMAKQKRICPDIGKIPNSKGRVLTTSFLCESMKKELYYEINEHYLFHGAKEEYANTIASKGFDPKVASPFAMFGKGVYAAEESSKSDQYTDSVNQRKPNGTHLYLFLTRMLLGNVYLCSKDLRQTLKRTLFRPPCISCFEDNCTCETQELFDSVMVDGHWLFREFVVYEGNLCYPEYAIIYKRIG